MKNMKNKKGVFVALAVMLVIVAIISVLSVKAVGGRETSGKTVFSFGGQVELRNTIELPISEVGALEVIYTSRNIKVYPTEGDTIVIKEYLLAEHKEGLATVTYEEIEGDTSGRKKTTVKGNQDNVITIFGFHGGSERIEIYLPKEGLDALSVKLGSGSVTAQDSFAWETKDLQVTTGSGSIEWQETTAESAQFTSGSGKIVLKGIRGDVQVTASSGSIRLEEITGDMTLAAGSGSVKVFEAEGVINVAAGSGSIAVENLIGCGCFATGSGSINVNMEQVTGDIGIGAGSGSVDLVLPKELSFTLEAKSGSGSIDTDFDDALSYNKKGNEATGVVGENPACKITVETKSGKIDIAAE